MSKLYIMDTNILCCYLKIPGKEVVGNGKQWNFETIMKKINEIEKDKGSIVIPLPVMIELGNHIGHEKDYERHGALEELIEKTIENTAPFHSFNQQRSIWKDENLKKIISEWKKYLFQDSSRDESIDKKKGLGLGDIFVLALASYFKTDQSGHRYDVEIWSADNGIISLQDTVFFSDIEVFETPSPNIKKKRTLRNK